jgi:hypothetical protein
MKEISRQGETEGARDKLFARPLFLIFMPPSSEMSPKVNGWSLQARQLRAAGATQPINDDRHHLNVDRVI